MIRRIEVRTFDDIRYYFEHIKPTLRHIKMLCGLRAGPVVKLFPPSSVVLCINKWRACKICKSHPAAIDHQFSEDYDDAENY